MKQHFHLFLPLTALVAATCAPALADAPVAAMLDRIEPGAWELRTRDEGGRIERLCVRSTDQLIQLRHPQPGCRRIVVDDTPSQVTVQYTCPGRGYGRTAIRLESARLIQIDTQGIAGGLPFAFAAEGRRTGNCTP